MILNPTKEMLDTRKKWVAALRSGEYKQCRNRLHLIDQNDQHLYCCLGVACEIFNAKKSVKTTSYINGLRNVLYFKNDNDDTTIVSFLPNSIQSILGLNGELLETVNDGSIVYDSLWEMNDSGQYNFNKIADVIEEQFIKPYEKRI